MNTLIKLEELAKLILSYYLSLALGYSWWLFFALLLIPDLSMTGYLLNKRIGAWTYNFFHHQGIAIMLGIAGYMIHDANVQLVALVLFGHSSMDRALGYGLKYENGFQYTHLGEIGKQKK